MFISVLILWFSPLTVPVIRWLGVLPSDTERLEIPKDVLIPLTKSLTWGYYCSFQSLSYDSHNLTVPVIRWLGVLPSDIERLQVPKDVLIPLNKADLDKANELMQRPYYHAMPHWMKEVGNYFMLWCHIKGNAQSGFMLQACLRFSLSKLLKAILQDLLLSAPSMYIFLNNFFIVVLT